VKPGAIIPLVKPNNNVHEIDKSTRIYEIYPLGKGSFTEYDDDGTTQEYLSGKGATTLIETDLKKFNGDGGDSSYKGDFTGFEKQNQRNCALIPHRNHQKLLLKLEIKGKTERSFQP